jgi:MEDS: MEthanogen/methylotroph, DcmR Sensory domain
MVSPSNPSVAYFRLGDHICLFYRSQKQLLATLVPYIQLGLWHNERCFCILSREVSSQLLAALGAAGIQTDRLIERGALVLVEPQQSYFDCGKFDPGAMTKLLASGISEAVHKGFSGFRSAGDMRWALEGKPGCNRLLEYETLMETFFPGRPAVGLCCYPVDNFQAEKLEHVLAVHRRALLEDHPAAQHRTLRIRGRKFFGDVAFAEAEGAPFHCVIQQASSGEIVSSTQEKSLGAATSSIERQLRALGDL